MYHKCMEQLSEIYQNRVAETRKGIAHHTLEEPNSIDKREQAKALRMEILLVNSEIINNASALLQKYPNVSREELIEALKLGNDFPFPEATEQMVDLLITNRDNTLEAFKALNKIEGDKSGAELIFNKIGQILKSNDDLWPNHKVTIEFTPLGLHLHVQDGEDFKNFLTDGAFLVKCLTLDEIFQVEIPVIVSTPDYSLSGDQIREIQTLGASVEECTKNLYKIAIEHEKTHVINLLLKRLSGQIQGRDFWVADLPYFPNEGKDNLAQLKLLGENLQDNDQQIDRNSDLYRQTLGYAVSMLKDEIIAYFSSTLNPNKYVLDILSESVLFEDGYYNFFAFHFKMDESSPLYQALWQDYLAIAKDSIEVAIKLYSTYLKLTPIRCLSLSGVLAQIPFEEWPKQLSETLFVDEADSIERIIALLDRCNDQILSQIEPFLDDISLYFADHPTEPFLPKLREIEIHLQNILS